MLLLDLGAGGDFKSATHFGTSRPADMLGQVRKVEVVEASLELQ